MCDQFPEAPNQLGWAVQRRLQTQFERVHKRQALKNILLFSSAVWIMPRLMRSSLFLLNFNCMSIWVSNNQSLGETELLSMIHNDARRNKVDLSCG